MAFPVAGIPSSRDYKLCNIGVITHTSRFLAHVMYSRRLAKMYSNRKEVDRRKRQRERVREREGVEKR